ncbi:MAG TPA: DnaJ domain-containing protein [Ktedonobacteraceae bacterium]
MDTSNDYYATLGVDPQASASAIKTAFKKLAFQYHPDVYRGTDAQERMRVILQAYQILSDPEARKEYDAQRHNGGGGGGARADTVGGAAARKGKGAGNGQGRFAFPDLRETPVSTLAFSLEGITYRLSSAQAESLKWDGMLRGDAPVADAGALYTCQRCHHRWSARGNAHPATCPNCHARDWADYLLLRCIHCQAVFASKELRDHLHGDVLYQPYELFPLCPSCRRSQWCPAENSRVHRLRAAAARRSALLWGSVAVIAMLLTGLLVLFLLR